MIKKADILYIYQLDEHLVIETINGQEVFKDTFEQFMMPYCLAYLTTLKGRLDAIKIKYHWRKQVPLFIDSELVLFPIANQKDLNNIYINAYNIKRISSIDVQKSQIFFKNGHTLLVSKSAKMVEKYYLRALSIEKQ